LCCSFKTAGLQSGQFNFQEIINLYLLFAVPSHSPLIIWGHNTSSTSISVRWEAIPTEFIHGILLGYKVFYGKTNEPPSQYKTLQPDQLEISLTNLEKFTAYCVKLAGFTRIGDGNKSSCFNVTTDEDGKSIPCPRSSLLTGDTIKYEEAVFIL